ncbi:molybdopterin-guanine dinucleotide biosynthesis protein B [Blautia schinkii]|nr:molybdopterin-guanine dinucleotide biosynthesis protein B [Blautia schinkii]
MRTKSTRGIPVIAFAGYSNSGKTTIIKALIPLLKAHGLRVAVLKHDAHSFEMDHQGRDTWEYANAGADVIAISSPKKMAYIETRSQELSVWELIERIDNADLILVEGYKSEPLPKIEVRRRNFPLLPEQCRDTVIAVVCDTPAEASVPVFRFSQATELCNFILNCIDEL